MNTRKYRLAGPTLVVAILSTVLMVRLTTAADAQMAAGVTMSGSVELP